MSLNYKILLKPEPEGGYTVNVPALPGCVTYGVNLAEAQVNAREAIELYIEFRQTRRKIYEVFKTS